MSEGGEIFNLWQDPPVNIYIKIYLWNITNSEEFLSGKEKMRVEEVGPYVYRYTNFFSSSFSSVVVYTLLTGVDFIAV